MRHWRTTSKQGYLTGNGHDYSFLCPPPIVSPAPPPEAAEDSEVLSTTNVQVAGVDEADVVKATADYLYSLDFPLSDIPLSKDAQPGCNPSPATGFQPMVMCRLVTGVFPFHCHAQRECTVMLQTQGLYHYEPESESDSQSAKLIYLAKPG